MALSGHHTRTYECPLSGVKRTSLIGWPMSANDPKRTSQLEFRPLTAGISLRFGCDNLL